MQYFDEPDGADEPTEYPLSQQSYSNESIPIEVNESGSNTNINTMSYFDEPDPNTTIHSQSQHIQESSASPPPPTASLSADIDTSSKLVDAIPEDTEKDDYRADDDDHEQENANKLQNGNEVDEKQRLEALEADLESIKEKLDKIKIDNEDHNDKLTNVTQESLLTAQYDRKIMEYDKELTQQQKLIEEEERLIAELKKKFDDKLAEYNMDESTLKNSNTSDMNGVIRNSSESNTFHAQQSSIVLNDNSFAINCQLQFEIDKLENQIEWLQTSKIELVKSTSSEVDRLRNIIKKFGGK